MNLSALPYEFYAPQRIVFGWGARQQLATLLPEFGHRAFIVSGSRTLESSPFWTEIMGQLAEAGSEAVHAVTIRHEPVVEDVDQLSTQLRGLNASPGDFVLVVGGGSAVDLAKAAAAMATNRQGDSVKDFLEGVGRGLAVTVEPLPVVAMPTTGGTGAEATKNAVISSYDPPFKKSIRSPRMIPRLVVVDPELGVGVAAETTAYTGMDAITQLVEAYITRNARPIPRTLCVEGLRHALPAIVPVVRDGTCRAGREAMAYAAMLSGMALANAGLGMAHGVAGALGSVCQVTHGLACAVMLPVALRVNYDTCRADLARLAREVLPQAFASDEVAARTLVDRITSTCDELKIPRRLSQLGVRREQIPDLVQGTRGNSMNGNPRELSDDQLRAILEEML